MTVKRSTDIEPAASQRRPTRRQREQIKEALDLAWDVFQEFEAPEYAQEGINEFRRFISYLSIVESFDKGALHFGG